MGLVVGQKQQGEGDGAGKVLGGMAAGYWGRVLSARKWWSGQVLGEEKGRTGLGCQGFGGTREEEVGK